MTMIARCVHSFDPYRLSPTKAKGVICAMIQILSQHAFSTATNTFALQVYGYDCDVSYAYPLLSVGYIVTAVAGKTLFGEALGPVRLAGVLVICLGVYLITRSA